MKEGENDACGNYLPVVKLVYPALVEDGQELDHIGGVGCSQHPATSHPGQLYSRFHYPLPPTNSSTVPITSSSTAPASSNAPTPTSYSTLAFASFSASAPAYFTDTASFTAPNTASYTTLALFCFIVFDHAFSTAPAPAFYSAANLFTHTTSPTVPNPAFL